MLTDIELPGFPPEDGRPCCLYCDTPLFPEGEYVVYTEAEFKKWEESIRPRSAPRNTVFRDLHGKAGRHTPTCDYRDLPPIALWQQDLDLMDHIRTKLSGAKQSSP
ncbi:hypothetical protein [Streptomyces sp. NBC_00576]|uniref:hypothetical protein n=1 Tax=Streptomyces sp. NBC_00576 TaxID=2903665 RepID=UPI002E8151B6|nr:hypothetical protein [Streptomyces sp. NBC_00576]WUB71545.1 hypothetical protein OG734_16375 [Streptomyces sp. NBC_00576]